MIEQKDLEDFLTFLRFQSVSADSAYKNELLACCEWVQDYLQKLGFTVEVWPTSGHPIIFATYLKAGPDKPTLLTYNHYDVQPIDPINEWDNPPFEPTIKDGVVYARGTTDNKGQCFYTLLALKTLIEKEGTLPVNVKMIIEGEEEIGSHGLVELLEEKKDQLKADYTAIIDMGMEGENAPAVTLGVRGIVTMDVHAKGSNMDLHSGMVGGMVYNPLHALVTIFSQLRDPKSGKITIPGFYDNVAKLSEEERNKLDFSDPVAFTKQFETIPSGGEIELPAWERVWLRPTLEINGLHGGYGGEGFKTVIPREAIAKVSCRLVPNQNPEKVGEMVKKAICDLAPEGIEITVDIHEGSGKASQGNPASAIAKAFHQAYEEVFQTKPHYIYSGGTIPAASNLHAAVGGDIVFVGVALPTDGAHAPNEHISLNRVEKGKRSIERMLQLLSSSC